MVCWCELYMFFIGMDIMKNIKVMLVCLLIANTCLGDLSFYEQYQDYKAREALNGNQYDQAASRLEELLVEHPDHALMNFNTGVIALDKGNWQRAIDSFSRVIQVSKDKSLLEKAYINLGNAHVKNKQAKEALSAYKDAVKINPDNEHVQHNIEKLEEYLKQQSQQDNKNENDRDKKDKKDSNGDDQQKQEQQKDQEKNQSDQSKKDGDGKDQDKGQQDQSKNGKGDDGKDSHNSKPSSQGDQKEQDASGNRDPKQDSQKHDGKDDGKQNGRDNKSDPANSDAQKKGGGIPNPDQDSQGEQKPPSVSHDQSQQDLKDKQNAQQSHHTGTEQKKPENKLNTYMQEMLEQLDKEDKAGNKMFMRAQLQDKMKEGHGQKNW
jgi:Ca-activated chloride channel homolog